MTYKSIVHNPYKIVKMFEEEVCEYTGAPYAVAVDSCTNALFLCCKFLQVQSVEIPKETYLSVPMAIMQAGGKVVFKDIRWHGLYQLFPYPIYDAAKRFTSDMYNDIFAGSYMCLSFHIKKHLKIGKGGMILTDNPEAVEWLKRARYEGRSEKNYHNDNVNMMGWNMYLSPEQAARGLALMQNYPAHVEDLPEEPKYKDLTTNDYFSDLHPY